MPHSVKSLVELHKADLSEANLSRAIRLIPSLTNMALIEMYARAVRETARERIGTHAHDEARAVEQMLREALESRINRLTTAR